MKLEELQLTEAELSAYNEWTKEQIYIAFIENSRKIDDLSHKINEYERKLALIRYNLKNVMG